MKIGFNSDKHVREKELSFEGYKPVKSEFGSKEYEFNYVFDDENFDCYLELFRAKKDSHGNYFITGNLEDNKLAPVQGRKNRGIKIENIKKPLRINLSKFQLSPDEGIGYHYKLLPKNQPNAAPLYRVDSGMMVNETTDKEKHRIYNIIPVNAPSVAKGGAMRLILPDNHNVAWVYDDDNKIVPNPKAKEALKSIKNIANKIGGSLAGIEKDLDDGKFDNYSRIITTPMFTDDSLSAHAYWNKNNFQMVHTLGNINNYASIQRKLFAKGINLVADGAFVNEGLEGVHFRHVLRWGEKSPYFNWFKINVMDSRPVRMGVFGNDITHVTHRLVNSPYKFIQKDDGTIKIKNNDEFDSKAPTYLQIYDNRLVNARNLSSKKLIKAYEKFNTNFKLDINNHDNTVMPYSFRIDPEAYKENVEILNSINKEKSDSEKINLYSGKGTRLVSQFKYFGLDNKMESGFKTWDSNTDIAKLNFVYSHCETEEFKNIQKPKLKEANIKKIKEKNYEVQDYVVSSGEFWSKKTNQILTLNVAQHLKNIEGLGAHEIYNKISKQLDGKVFPKDLDINENIVKNVIKGRYELKGGKSNGTYEDIIIENMMNFPLDSIEVGDDIVAVLASPLVTKRANRSDYVGKSRYEMHVNGNKHVNEENFKTYHLANRMYTDEMKFFAEEILKSIHDDLPYYGDLYDNYGKVTEYGKYVLPMLLPEIVRFLVIKTVSPNEEIKFDSKTGEIKYDYNKLKNTSLLSMGIIADSPEDEATTLINKIRSRIGKISSSDKNKLATALRKSIEGTNVNSFRLAEMIVNRTQAGLDWRIDATKDIGDIASLRNKKTDLEYTWNEILKFWSKYTEGLKKYHPDVYIVAEVTDDMELYDKGWGGKSGARFSNNNEMLKKLILEAGFTTIANYNFMSSNINEIFGNLFDFDGEHTPDKGTYKQGKINEILSQYLHTSTLESIIYSYIFAGNHDKCRALEGYAVDMNLVYADLTSPLVYPHMNEEDSFKYKERAYRILNGVKYGQHISRDAVAKYNYNRVSTLAVAKAETLSSGIGRAKEKLNWDRERKDYVYDKMIDALKNLANSKHLGKNFEADGFGQKPIDIAFDILVEEMNYIEPDVDYRLTDKEKDELKKMSLELILGPAISRLLGHTKFLAGLCGNVTIYDGDDLGSTGFETTTKNITVQNRNVIHNEWADKNHKDYMKFIKDLYDNTNYQVKLRSRPGLQALNDGTPYLLKLQDAEFNNGKKTHVSAMLRQNPKGYMSITIFNEHGLNHKFDEYYTPAEIKMKEIEIDSGYGIDSGLGRGIRQGLKFVNAADPNDIYYTRNKDGKYKLVAHNPNTGEDKKEFSFNDTTLVLYHDPSFTGRKKVLYNPQYNFTSNYYEPKKEVVTGKQLLLNK